MNFGESYLDLKMYRRLLHDIAVFLLRQRRCMGSRDYPAAVLVGTWLQHNATAKFLAAVRSFGPQCKVTGKAKSSEGGNSRT